MKLKKKKFLFLGILVLILGGIFLYRYIKTKNDAKSTQPQISFIKTEKGNIIEGVSASGQIETANYLAVTTSVNGIVKKVYVKEGDKIVQGQTLMEITLDSEGEKSRLSSYTAYLRAKNSLQSAKDSLYQLESSMIQKKETFDNLKKTNSYQTHDERLAYKLAENDYLSAKASYDNKQNEISTLQMSLTSAWQDYEAQSPIVTAPSNGVVANIVAVEGSKVTNSVSERSVYTVAAIKKEGNPIATLNITEIDINKVKVGQKVYLTLSSISGKIFTGVVAGIDKVGTTTSGVANYPVIVKFDESSENVLPNMSVEGQIVVNEKQNVLLVPSSAITNKNNGKTVQVQNNGTTETVSVETGITDGSYTEITSGLKEGDRVEINDLPTSGFTSTGRNSNRGGFFLGPGIR